MYVRYYTQKRYGVCVCTFSAVCLSTASVASVACSFGETALELLFGTAGGRTAVLLNTGENPDNTVGGNRSRETVNS